MEAVPDASYAYNQLFDRTNTSKSLLKGLEATGDDSVLWLNGDVVFDRDLMKRLDVYLAAESSFVAVNRSAVGDEEIKYRTDVDGNICELSKEVVAGLGEAVGVNFVSAEDKHTLIEKLRACEPEDYFERGIEMMIESPGLEVRAADVSGVVCIEVDFESDLATANDLLLADRSS